MPSAGAIEMCTIGQDMDGSLVHILWGCPNVQSYWSFIKDKLKRIVGFDIPFCPRLFVLGDPSILGTVSPPIAEWNQTALMLGRRLLVKDWKASSAPAISLWFSTLGQVAAYERLSYRLLDRMDKYDQKWGHYHLHLAGLTDVSSST